MTRFLTASILFLGFAGPALAGAPAPGPAPVLGAGLPGLLALGVAGAGYLAVRAYRSRR